MIKTKIDLKSNIENAVGRKLSIKEIDKINWLSEWEEDTVQVFNKIFAEINMKNKKEKEHHIDTQAAYFVELIQNANVQFNLHMEGMSFYTPEDKEKATEIAKKYNLEHLI